MNPTYEHRRPYDGCDLYRGDALEVLPLLAGQGIVADMVLSDPPYGTTHCRWDAVIDIRGMWNAIQGVSAPGTPILLGEDTGDRFSQCRAYADESARGHSRVL